MKIVISGGSGQIGTILARHFHSIGSQVIVLTRSSSNRLQPWKSVQWDGETLGPWTSELEGADVLINLAGRTVNCRYTYRNRWQIWSSRSRSTRILGSAVRTLRSPPKVWIQSSTATIYAHRYDEANDEHSGELGGSESNVPETWRFSIDVARAWEGEFNLLDLPTGVRRVVLRSALTMSPDSGGVFDYLLWLVRVGLGGAVGKGDQFVSWVHYVDFTRTIEHILAHEELDGVINVAAPTPIRNREFMSTLRTVVGRRFGLHLYRWMVEVGAFFMRTESELVLKSRRVVSTRLTESGFEFTYPTWDVAARDLCERWNALRS